MPVKEFNTPYPVIDTDPHFNRVVSYMRPTDYAAWAAGTAAAPAFLLGMGKNSSQRQIMRMDFNGQFMNRKNRSRWTYP